MEENTPTLLERTRAMLAQTEHTYLEIHARTGLRPNWLSALACGRLREPSVNKVQRLYEYLSGQQLVS